MWNDEVDPNEKEALRQSEIQQSLGSLKSGDLNERKAAIKRLGELQTAPEVILPFLGDSDLGMRVEAINALGNYTDVVSGDVRSEMVSHLAGALNDPNRQVISSAVRSLGLLRAKEVIPEIRELLDEDDKDQQIVHNAIIALARLEDHASLEKILTFLDAPTNYLRQAAWHAIGLFNYTPIIPVLLSNLKVALEKQPLSPPGFAMVREYIDVCRRLKATAAVPLLIQIIQTEIGLRTNAVNALLGLDIETFPEELLELLDDPNSRLRASVLKLISQTGYFVPPARIHRLLNDRSPNIRIGTLELACQHHVMASLSTVRFLCYRDRVLFVRAKAIAALVNLMGMHSLPDLHALAFDPQPAIRSAVASSIGDLGEPLPAQAISILEHLRNNDETREMADAILQRSPDRTIPSGPLASPGLGLQFPDPWVVTRRDFLTACMQWYTTLGKAAADPLTSDEAIAVQSALSSLIVTLSREQ